ncbi:alpha/beta hydrolase (plasmid) [Nicoliella spurrieriana]|uniref:Alpha/beta hydrolase n=1 Tax=Nicoliella spurrieriana TaxID=2925830 RepID=A0A976X4U0_9LACO|nr:alpha/beta hydrolase [Nicoliella spurrieriana]UQS85921.1 alpha/beta hydrolase [Nicoliella spurrieriana]
MSTKRKVTIAITTIISIIVIVLCAASAYLYTVISVPAKKSFLSNATISRNNPLYQNQQWFLHTKKDRWFETAAGTNLKLDAYYIPAQTRTNKTAIIAHGYMGNKDTMGVYASLFHQLGYNVLIPDDRGQGQSQGDYIGYGWPDRRDYVKWMHQVVRRNSKQSKIIMFGVSMGGATTMMTSGESDVPKQVKAFIEDCGYDSITNELKHEAKQLYHMPTIPFYPIEPMVSVINKVKNGFFYGDGNSVKQVAKNHRPMLFIHGSNDHFVPTKMVYPVYRASKGPKQLLIVKGAGHASSYQHNKRLYEKTVQQFLNRYVK